ncbi:MAG TPA: ABC transporter permease [Blastocatellia bacterium]|nr:ABC transporter permease [Blastocatellia bacterium]
MKKDRFGSASFRLKAGLRSFRFWLWLITFIGVIVPRRFRARFQQEWEAELEYREAMLVRWDRLDWRNKFELLWRSLGAFWDALWLQRQRWEDEMIQDLRFGVRMLLKHPGFTLIAVITLALGIGANTAIFSVVNAVVLRPLPYPEPERLIRLWESNPGRGWPEFSASAPNFADWRKQQTVFEQLAAYEFATFNITGGDEPERVAALGVTANLFPTLGTPPALGRDFLPEEEQAGRHRVAILSDGLWRRRFGADPQLIGRQIQLSGESYTVVGVMPPRFQLTPGAELWTPLMLDPALAPWHANRSHHIIHVIGRLKPDVSLAQAQAAMDVLARQLEQQYPKSNAGWGARLRTFYDWLVPEQVRRSVLVLFAAVGFVLLIACANVANLTLARASTRRREMAIRAAMGAGRLRVMRQLLTESLLLAGLGGLAGALLARWGAQLIKASSALNIPRLDETRLDLRALGFTLTVSLLTGLIFGLAPAWQASKLDLNETLKEGGRGGGVARRGLRGALVIGEVALALVLLLSAGLMIRSFANLQNAPLGFAPENVLAMQINLPGFNMPGSKYGEKAQRVNFYNQLLERMRATPGVVDAAAVTQLPLFSGASWAQEITLEGREAAPSDAKLSARTFAATPRYFQTMGIPLLQGRDFTEQDSGDGPLSFIVSESFARRFWPNENPIGKRFRASPAFDMFGTVVGVIGNVRNVSLESEGGPAFYFSYGRIGMPALAVIVRTVAPPETMAAALRAPIASLDRDLPVYNVRTLDQLVYNSAGQPRFQTALLSFFGAIALLLAAIGVYGVMAYAVSQRMREIGLRMALGAQTRDVLKLVVRQGLALSLIGVAIGLALAFGLTRFLSGLLYQVSATDALTFALIPLLLVGVTLLACYLPARRAIKVDPLLALRRD